MIGVEYIVPPVIVGFFLLTVTFCVTLVCCGIRNKRKRQTAAGHSGAIAAAPHISPLTVTGSNYATMTDQRGQQINVPIPETNIMQYGEDRASITTPQGMKMNVPLPKIQQQRDMIVNMLRQQGHTVDVTTTSNFEPVSHSIKL